MDKKCTTRIEIYMSESTTTSSSGGGDSAPHQQWWHNDKVFYMSKTYIRDNDKYVSDTN